MKADDVQMVGIIQEQHADRCKLFMQWKKMDWPILVDSYNRLEVAAVPITLLIDEHGIIRKTRARWNDLSTFINQEFPKPTEEPPATRGIDQIKRQLEASVQSNASTALERAQLLVEWGDSAQLSTGIDQFESLKANRPDDGWLRFRLGVAYRKRHDSSGRQKGDFAKAIGNWKAALDIDPNQYIWRRRIQQYGPRLDKPYPFYDWVPQAREEITKRGETPAPLKVEPGGAEFARPSKDFGSEVGFAENPDPNGRIIRDSDGLIRLATTVVPSTAKGAVVPAVRVHLEFATNQERKAHWNNEAEDLVVWFEKPAGWILQRQLSSVPNDQGAVSDKPRRIEIELKRRVETGADAELKGYALYYACEDLDGVCVYRRQDFTIKLD